MMEDVTAWAPVDGGGGGGIDSCTASGVDAKVWAEL